MSSIILGNLVIDEEAGECRYVTKEEGEMEMMKEAVAEAQKKMEGMAAKVNAMGGLLNPEGRKKRPKKVGYCHWCLDYNRYRDEQELHGTLYKFCSKKCADKFRVEKN